VRFSQIRVRKYDLPFATHIINISMQAVFISYSEQIDSRWTGLERPRNEVSDKDAALGGLESNRSHEGTKNRDREPCVHRFEPLLTEFTEQRGGHCVEDVPHVVNVPVTLKHPRKVLVRDKPRVNRISICRIEMVIGHEAGILPAQRALRES
jgi:hypothetical protein